MKKIFLIITCMVFSGYADWIQIGQDIDGEAANDESGHSVALSSDGAVFAIGTMNNDNNGANSGHVRVYQYTSSIGMWTQLGMDIEGEASNDQSGHSVALSSDGSIVAIGALGNDANANGSGHVRVYEFDGISWTQLGTDIDGEAVNFEFFGAAVDINADGTIVAIGAVGNDGNGNDSGYVRVYQYDGIIWNQLGMDIEGEAANDQSGHSVTLSSDGTIVAIGARYNDGNGSNAGHVRVYQYDGISWTQLGTDIDGEAGSDRSGRMVSISSDGTIVAIGAAANDGNGSNAGHVRVYQYDDISWTQLGTDIDGEAAKDLSGLGVALSSDGTIVAIGAPWNGDSDNHFGHGRVYLFAPDSDGDGLSDYDEVNIYGTATNNVDTDGDGWGDYFEVNYSFSPTSSDSVILSNDLIVARSELDALSNDIVTLAAETNRLRDLYLLYYDANDQAQNEAEAVTFALQISSNQVAELTFTNNQLQEAMGTMLTSNDAHAMLDSAYVDDTVMIVSNNAASVIQVIEQSSNLTVGAWNEIKHITNTVPIDTDAAFFRFRLVE